MNSPQRPPCLRYDEIRFSSHHARTPYRRPDWRRREPSMDNPATPARIPRFLIGPIFAAISNPFGHGKSQSLHVDIVLSFRLSSLLGNRVRST